MHVFAPTFGRTFSGDAKLWVRSFQKWGDEQVNHYVMRVDQGKVVEARAVKSAFGEKSPSNLGSLPRWRRGLWAAKLLWLLIVNRNGYDILHVHADYWGALLVGPVGRLLRRPSVFHIVRMGEDDPTTLVRQSLGRIKLWCVKRFDRILCISEALRRECLQQGSTTENALLLTNAVDSTLFSPSVGEHGQSVCRRVLKLPEKSRIILTVGSIILRKGTDVLVDVFRSLATEYPDLCLVLVGPASSAESASVDEHFVSGLRQRIAAANLVDRVIFTGRIDDDATLANYYRAADIFAFPTRQEGLGNVVLEAMSAGLPVLATHLPGITDLIVRDGETGFLTPPDDVPALKRKLKWLLDNPRRVRELGEAARASTVRNFGFEAWQTQLTRIYATLIEERQHSQ